MHAKTMSSLLDAKWIWLGQDKPLVNQFVCFRKRFELSGSQSVGHLLISADSDFHVWVNGLPLGGGQFSDWPQDKTFTRYDLSGRLREGQNVIAIWAYYRGEDFSEYRTGQPGLIATAVVGGREVVTDGSWKVRQHPAMISGPMPKVTLQMGFTWQFDARLDDAWTGLGYDDAAWPGASEISGALDGYWKTLKLRPVPPLHVRDNTKVSIVMQGDFRRARREGSFAEIMCDDLLVNRGASRIFTPLPPNGIEGYSRPRTHSSLIAQADHQRLELLPPSDDVDGRFLVLDFGREEVGILVLSLEAPEGTVLDISHGEHLDEGRVRASCGCRNFADRFICKEGDNRFVFPFRRLGARFLQVHISSFSRPVRIDYIGLAPTEFPLTVEGSFRTHDTLLAKLRDVGERTLRLCMHEHYEDCPWREQSLYAFDSRNQALYGYYAFGNYDFAQASLDLLGRGIRSDGLLELTAPGKVCVTIPIFSLVWIVELAEHWLHSGRDALFRRFQSQVRSMLETVFRRQDRATGLYRIPSGEGMWNYYDWMEGLAGSCDAENDPSMLHAPYNLFLLEAMQGYQWMLLQSGQRAEADAAKTRIESLQQAVFGQFWDDGRGALATYIDGGRRKHFCDLANLLAIKTGAVPEQYQEQILRQIYSRTMAPMALSPLLYLWLVLMDRDAESRRFCAETMARNFEPMVLQGATSLWETQVGSADFDNAGSLCHGWSALPVYHCHAHVLGVRPLEVGFRKFLIRPFPDRLYWAGGAVHTPAGPMKISWRKTESGLVVDAVGPEGLEPVVSELEEAPIMEAWYNGLRLT